MKGLAYQRYQDILGALPDCWQSVHTRPCDQQIFSQSLLIHSCFRGGGILLHSSLYLQDESPACSKYDASCTVFCVFASITRHLRAYAYQVPVYRAKARTDPRVAEHTELFFRPSKRVPLPLKSHHVIFSWPSPCRAR